MKKVITTIITAILPIVAMISSLQAQEPIAGTANSKRALLAPPATINSSAANLDNNSLKTKKELKKEARESKQFNRITRHFENNFKDATDVSWSKQNDGYTGAFTRDGLRNIVWYNQGGGITYLMVSYNEQRMPSDVKGIIKNAYREYDITWVNEVHHDDAVIYVVTLENNCTIKQVTVCNGELNIFREYKRA